MMAADYRDAGVPVATPELEQIIGRIQHLSSCVADIGRSANRTADRIFGAAPEPAMKGGGPATAGTLSLLYAALEGLEEQVRVANGQVQRLETL
jgi:hypothetical protein